MILNYHSLVESAKLNHLDIHLYREYMLTRIQEQSNFIRIRSSIDSIWPILRVPQEFIFLLSCIECLRIFHFQEFDFSLQHITPSPTDK